MTKKKKTVADEELLSLSVVILPLSWRQALGRFLNTNGVRRDSIC